MGAKILLFDIETTPLLGYTWGTYQQNVIQVVDDWQLLCVAAKWLDKREVTVASWREYSEEELVALCWDLLNEADIVVAHNGDGFDVKKLNAKFIEFEFRPPSPFKTVDTLKIARNHAKFTSNKLDDIGELLSLGRKIKTNFQLWLDCMAEDEKALLKMERYNIQDVKLLEKVYKRLRPWTPRHPNVALYMDTDKPVCAHCGSTKLEQWETPYYTNTQKYRKFQCTGCGGWSRLRTADGRMQTSKTPATIVADRK